MQQMATEGASSQETLRTELEQLKRQLQEKTTALEAAQSEAGEKATSVADLQTILTSAQAEKEQLKIELERLSTELQEKVAALETVKSEAESKGNLQNSLEPNQAEKDDLEAELEALKAQLQQKVEALNAVQSQTKGKETESQAEMEQIRTELEEKVSEVSKLQKEVDSLKRTSLVRNMISAIASLPSIPPLFMVAWQCVLHTLNLIVLCLLWSCPAHLEQGIFEFALLSITCLSIQSMRSHISAVP